MKKIPRVGLGSSSRGQDSWTNGLANDSLALSTDSTLNDNSTNTHTIQRHGISLPPIASIPKLHRSIPARGNQLARLMRQPQMLNDDLPVSPQPLHELAVLPIPEDDIARRVSRGDEPTIGGEADAAGIAGRRVTAIELLTVLAEAIGRVDEDLVVKRLSGKPFLWGSKWVRGEERRNTMSGTHCSGVARRRA